MPSTLTSTAAGTRHAFALLSLLAASAFAYATPQHEIDVAMPRLPLQKRATSYVGCYSSSQPLTSAGSYKYQSSGYCTQQCEGKSAAVAGLTGGDTCYCGDEIPAEDDKVDDSKCNSPCTGYGQDDCGGDGFFSVYTTGTESNVPNFGGSSSSSSTTAGPKSTSPSSTSVQPTVITSQVSSGQTLVVTVTPTANPEENKGQSAEKSGGGGSNTAGIAAGVVVGVVAVAAIAGGLFFWLRHKKRREAEEEYKRHNQVADFMRGGDKAPGTGYSGMSDQRLDPEAGAHRNSVGSLADNQDYSRRILRVANPDNS